MKVMMRLYRQHDLDLIYLYKLEGFSLQSAIKLAISACASGKPISIETPDVLYHQDGLTLPKQIQFHIYLPDQDKDSIEWISGITKGYRNSVLKNLIRNYIKTPVMTPFYNSVSLVFNTENSKKIPSSSKSKIIKPTVHKPNDNNLADAVLHAPLIPDTIANNPEMIEANETLKQQQLVSENPKYIEKDAMDMFDDLLNSFN